MTFVSIATKGAGSKVDAAYLATIKANFDEMGDAWTAYSPTWSGSGFTLGNGSVVGAWIELGKWAIFRFTATVGSTTTVGSSAYSFTLPATAAVINIPGGNMTIFDTSAPAVRQRNMYVNTTTTVAGQDEAGAFVTGAAPFALATGDTIKGIGEFQIA